jgi:hypothetical protein
LHATRKPFPVEDGNLGAVRTGRRRAYFPVAKGRGLADAQRRYRTHPGALDELDYEKLEESWGKDERERAREIERERAKRP